MSSFAHQAELEKLSRLLGQRPERLAFLLRMEPASMRKLREQASAALYNANHSALQRAADASRLLPGRLLALLAKNALGPLLCARIAGLMPTDKAMDIAKRLDADFLAKLCLELDPRSAQPLIAAMPPDRIAEIAVVLARQREFIAMARFVDALNTAAIKAVMSALSDDEAVLRIAFYVEDKARLDAIVRLLSDDRLGAIIGRSASSSELWPEGLALMSSLGDAQRQRVAQLAGAHDQNVILAMVRATQSHGLWHLLLPLVALMNPADQRRIARLAEDWDEALLLSVARAAHQHGLWQALLGLFAQMRNEAKPRLNRLAQQLSADEAKALLDLVGEKNLWAKLGELKDTLSKLG